MKRAQNSSNMKLHNMLELMNLVRKGSVSRIEASKKMGLTRAAVTIIVDRLEREGIICEIGAGESEVGRKPIILGMRADSFYFMGIDINRVSCSIGIVDVMGGIITSTKFDLPPRATFDSILPQIFEGVGQACRKLDGLSGRLQGIGVSVPGPLDPRAGVVFNPPHFELLQGQNVAEKLRKGLDFPLYVDNNAVARTLYEKNLGEGKQFHNFMVMTVDTGIGSGLLMEDELYRGMGYAGEVGHVSIDINGQPCSCGNRGCLEGFASIPALLRHECADRADLASWRDVADGAEQGDSHCKEVIATEARYLAQSIVNTANLLDIEAVILTGYVAYRPGLLLEEISRLVRNARITGNIHDIQILAAPLREDAEVVTAATIAMEKFFSGETDWNLQME
jgi:predicted NBD/HSP70 family sugar kinase